MEMQKLMEGTKKILPTSLKNVPEIRIGDVNVLFGPTYVGKCLSSRDENVDYKPIIHKNDGYRGIRMISDVKVRCECKSYYHWFWRSNKYHDSHYGDDMPPYKPKTDLPEDHPKRRPKNPDRIPGVCKHIVGLAMYLQEKDQ